MNKEKLISILQSIEGNPEIMVESGNDKDYDRTSILKIIKLNSREFLITDKDSSVHKSKGI